MPVSSQAAGGHRTARHTQREPARWRQEVLESLLSGVLRHATSDQPDHATAATYTSRKYYRSKPFVFSLDPRCQGLCGSQKYTGTSVSMVNRRCWDISLP